MTRREIIKLSGLALTTIAFPIPLLSFNQYNLMTHSKKFDVIIIGGSYAGLSAAMTLGRSLRDVLIIDGSLPCNRQTPHSHNLITQDGEKPSVITEKSKTQVLKYNTVKFLKGFAVDGKKTATGFAISTQAGEKFQAKKIIFATGVKDIMPKIKGFKECWGISVIHCPYCHGYEVSHQKTGILANGDIAFHYAQLINNWTKDLTIFTNGKANLTPEQIQKVAKNNIDIIEKEIDYLKHENGNVAQIVFQDKTSFSLKAIYARPEFEQHCTIPATLGCELTEQGHIKVDMFQKTSVEGAYACGDNASQLRTVSHAISTGTIAGAGLNNSLTEEEF